MASIVVEGILEEAQVVVAEREDAVVVPTSIVVDNSAGDADHTITIQDILTPSAYYGDEDPDPVIVNRWRTTVGQGLVDHFTEEDLKGAKCLGALYIDAEADDENCDVTVGYKHE